MENNENQFESRGERKPFGGRGDGKPRRDWNSRGHSFHGDRKPFRENSDFERPRRFENGERKPFRNFDGENSERREFKPRRFNDRPYRKFNDDERPRRFDGERKPFRNFDGENSEQREFKPRRFNDRPYRKFNDDERPRHFDGERKPFRSFDGENSERREFKPRRFNQYRPNNRFQKSYERPVDYTSIDTNLIKRNFDDEWNDDDVVIMDSVPQEEPVEVNRPATEAEGYRLNRFISNAGVCSRRAADDFIAAGKITLNGEVVTDFSTKVFPGDEVCLDGKKLTSQRRVYIVFNKPKNCISTKSDDLGRKTIFDYIKTDVEVKNVGRLDRDTTGVMLLTNDGDLIDRLTHPRYNKMKIYHVFLNKNLSPVDFDAIKEGVELDPITNEDGSEIKGGFVEIDDLQYVDGEKNQLGIQIHSGLYHVVRRIFEKFGYQVEKLDRVYFAGLTKKDLPRGHWRYLTQKEVAILKRGAYA